MRVPSVFDFPQSLEMSFFLFHDSLKQTKNIIQTRDILELISTPFVYVPIHVVAWACLWLQQNHPTSLPWANGWDFANYFHTTSTCVESSCSAKFQYLIVMNETLSLWEESCYIKAVWQNLVHLSCFHTLGYLSTCRIFWLEKILSCCTPDMVVIGQLV